MLAKIWKKLLLAVVVIAILFNITSKIVRRYSLDEQLNSVIGGESLSGLLHGDKDKANESSTNTKKENAVESNKKTNRQEDDEETEEYIEDEDYYYYEDEDSKKESKESKKSNEDEEVTIPYTTDDYFINFDDVQDYMKDWGF